MAIGGINQENKSFFVTNEYASARRNQENSKNQEGVNVFFTPDLNGDNLDPVMAKRVQALLDQH